MSEYALETRTGPETLDEIQRTLDQAWSEADIAEDIKMSIELAVSEIGTNIIEHSGSGDQPVQLRMVVALRPDSVTVTFTDDGHPAPVDLTRFEMPADLSERGRGLAIAHRVLDELAYYRDGSGNRWILVRRRSG
ncbi:ATP-binding protein [Mycolicibacterium sp. S3B2]|uniref:ATP-binding protein n=1 Tax=Mycolicibacterium sp. S3B2 TaxID=3415120 RepID=UPI003C7E0136